MLSGGEEAGPAEVVANTEDISEGLHQWDAWQLPSDNDVHLDVVQRACLVYISHLCLESVCVTCGFLVLWPYDACQGFGEMGEGEAGRIWKMVLRHFWPALHIDGCAATPLALSAIQSR